MSVTGKASIRQISVTAENGKHELIDTKQKFEESKQKLVAGKSLYFQPSDFKTELKIIGQLGEPGQKEKLS